MKFAPNYIRARLLQPADATESSSSSSLQAAVLVLLCPGFSGPVTILTRRSEDLPQHAGQISFPGGRVHHEDISLEATALREAMEEIGLDAADLVLLGRLPVVAVSSSGFEITPIVAWADSRLQLRPDPREVAEIIECPLDLALNPAAYKTGAMIRDGVSREFWYIEFGTYHVWGATARILRSLALLLADQTD